VIGVRERLVVWLGRVVLWLAGPLHAPSAPTAPPIPGLTVLRPDGPGASLDAAPLVPESAEARIGAILEGAMASARRTEDPKLAVAVWCSPVEFLPDGPAVRWAELQGDTLDAVIADAIGLGAGELRVLRDGGTWLIPRTDL
jgi:hypothetical protein